VGIFVIALMAAQVSLTAGPAAAAPAANIDQCANGGVGPPLELEACRNTNGDSNWVNGNVNGQKAHWQEGDFISYRAVLTDLAAGAHTLDIHWDTVHGGKHAIDYLGSFDATETTSPTATQLHRNANDPCGDVFACTPSSPQAIAPVGAFTPANCGGSAGTFSGSQVAGAIKLFGTAITGAASFSYLQENVAAGQGQCSSFGRISFSTTGAHQDVVIAWGGHIASQQDWGTGNSASGISGSPYHMALDFLDGASTGSQDRALSTSAIFFVTSITTSLVPSGSVSVGTSVHDTATLSGALANAGGSVFYRYYTSVADCQADATAFDGTVGSLTHGTSAGTGAVNNGVVGDSNSVPFNSAGSFFWAAFYSGDGSNLASSSDCTSEPLTVTKNSPSLGTTPSPTSANIGDALNDSATLSGASNPTGSITFYLFAPGDNCADTASAVYTETVALTGNSASTTGGGTGNNHATQAGVYHWLATYPGDANNNAATSQCGDEPVDTGKNSPTLGTTPSPTSGNIGDALNDTATLSGASNPTGSITFYLFAPGDNCSNTATAVYTETVALSGNSASTTGGGTGNNHATQAGTYHWMATYPGDANNNPASSDCGDEPVTIAMISPTLATQANPTSGNIGDALNDTATLSGASNPTGSITFDLFAPGDGECSEGSVPVYTETVPLSGNSASTTGGGSGSNIAMQAGTYHWLATYSGDPNNNPATSPCGSEPVEIAQNTPNLTTNTTPDSGKVGMVTLKDSANLTGATSDAGGTINFYLFAPGVQCTASGSGSVYRSKGVPVNGNGVYHSVDGTESGNNSATKPGTYHWLAVYSGDANNKGTNSGCGTEPVKITALPPAPPPVINPPVPVTG
jgi:hypothetical protein